ncbi:MAG: hypothetical protein ABI648_14815 [Betaproteobacteria bacterium]|jgi:hypothetical protein
MKTKSSHAARPLKGDRRKPPKPPNPNLNAQTRKVLAKHYRAKYGVK